MAFICQMRRPWTPKTSFRLIHLCSTSASGILLPRTPFHRSTIFSTLVIGLCWTAVSLAISTTTTDSGSLSSDVSTSTSSFWRRPKRFVTAAVYRDMLDEKYRPGHEPGFSTAGLCLFRDRQFKAVDQEDN